MNCALERSIEHYAKLAPDRAAVICGGETLSYSCLWERIRQRAEQLREAGLREGRPHVFVATQDADFIITYCAVHLCGAVCVPLEASTPRERQQQIRDELNGKFSPPKGGRGGSDILYTTGTTGAAKGVILSTEAWKANAENLIDRLGFASGLLFIVCGPLNHLGSLSKIYPTLMTGSTLYLLENLKDLGAFFSIFEMSFSRFATFLVPSSIRMLLQFAREELAAVAQKVDFIETGAAPISQHDMEQLWQVLPHSRLSNTYASTETGIVCSYEFSRYGCRPGVVGRPMKHSSVRIDEDGRVVCSGSTLMSGYVAGPEATAQVLVGGEVRMSDLGFIDENGMLCLKGRGDDVINVGGYKVNPIEVEDAVSSFGPVQDCICIPAPHVVLGSAPKLLYVPRQGQNVKPRDITDFLKCRIESYKIPLFYEAVDAIKRTYNGKLDRKAYL